MGRAYANLTKERDGSIRFESSYDPQLVENLKLQIPYQDRQWNKGERAWFVSLKHVDTLIDLVDTFLGVKARTFGDLSATTSQTVTQLIMLEYLGAARERPSGDTIASGWVNDGWNAIFSLKVLKDWFEGAPPEGAPVNASTLYGILGIPRNAVGIDIKKGYRRAARQWHPDYCREPGAADQFIKIKEAYDVLSNPQMRRRYDASLKLTADTSNVGESSKWLCDPFQSDENWRPPLRCGWVMVEAVMELGRYKVKKILSWQDIERRGKTMVSWWPKDADQFASKWV